MRAKKLLLMSLIAMISMGMFAQTQQGVSISSTGTQAHPSAMLDVQSTTQGFLAPRMTKSQRDNIENPADGLLIYQIDNTKGFYFYNAENQSWETIVGAASPWNFKEDDIYYDAGNVGIGTDSPMARLQVIGKNGQHLTFGNGTPAPPGFIAIAGKGGSWGGTGGQIHVLGGFGGVGIHGGRGGDILIKSGDGATETAGIAGSGGTLTLSAGNGGMQGATGGDVIISPGNGEWKGKILIAPNFGMVGIKTNQPAAELDVNGSFIFTGGNGDVSGDGLIDMNDAILVYDYCFGNVSLTREQLAKADVNADNKVDLTDSYILYYQSLGYDKNTILRNFRSVTGITNLGHADTIGDETFTVNGLVELKKQSILPPGFNSTNKLYNLDGDLFFSGYKISLPWALTGNIGTNPSSHFIGTIDNNALVFRTNNTERMRINTNGRVGIGRDIPMATLDVINTNLNQSIGLRSILMNEAATGNNYGGFFQASQGGDMGSSGANFYGVYGKADANRGEDGASIFFNYGVYGVADGDNTEKVFNYGIYGTASGGAKNFAGFFNEGIVHIANQLGIGTQNPSQQLHLTGSIEMPNTLGSNDGIIFKNGQRFLHNRGDELGGEFNTYLGINSGNLASGGGGSGENFANTGLGALALNSLQWGSENTAIGMSALRALTGGNKNTALGNFSGRLITVGNSNILLGYYAGRNLTTGSGNILIGNELDAPAANASNRLIIGNSNFIYGDMTTGNIGLGNPWPQSRLDVGGDIGASNIRLTDNINPVTIAPDYNLYIEDITIFEAGKDDILNLDGSPAGLYWSNPDVGNGRFEFRTRNGSFLNLGAAYIYASGYHGNWHGNTIPVYYGGTGTTMLTASKLLVGNGYGNVLTPVNLHWDNTNSRLGIGVTNPSHRLHVNATNPLRLEGLQNSTQNDMLVVDASGVVTKRSITTAPAWFLTGNSGTNPTSNFIGTSDNQPLVFRTNNAERMRITNNGRVAIGTNNPDQNTSLHVSRQAHEEASSCGIYANVVHLDLDGVTSAIIADATSVNDALHGDQKTYSVMARAKHQHNESMPWGLTCAIYGTATGGTYNWAGYFKDGNVYIENKLGINNVLPQYALDVNGQVRISGGNPGVGKVLTSDANGVASWQNLALSGSGTASKLAFWSGTNTLSSNTNLHWDNTNMRLGVGISTPTERLHVNGNVLATGNLTVNGTITGNQNLNAYGFSWNGISGVLSLIPEGVKAPEEGATLALNNTESPNLYLKNKGNGRLLLSSDTYAIPSFGIGSMPAANTAFNSSITSTTTATAATFSATRQSMTTISAQVAVNEGTITYGVRSAPGQDNEAFLSRWISSVAQAAIGVYGKTAQGTGVYGEATATNGTGRGVYGESASATAIEAYAKGTNSTARAVHSRVDNNNAYSVYAQGGRNYFQGNVGIGTTDPQTNLHVNGNIRGQYQSADGSQGYSGVITWAVPYDGSQVQVHEITVKNGIITNYQTYLAP